jgi:DNA-binding IclR family transcriptional regulator
MQQMSLPHSLLVLVFRSARSGRQPNLTALCQRSGASVAELQRAFDVLESQGLLSAGADGERLTLQGLAVASALSKQASRRHRPIASCRPLAA